VPAEEIVRFVVATAGDAEVTEMLLTVAPSIVNVTVPVGYVLRLPEGFTLAVTCSVLPADGVVVAGIRLKVVEFFEAVIVLEVPDDMS
jgi:hypothetical protein